MIASLITVNAIIFNAALQMEIASKCMNPFVFRHKVQDVRLSLQLANITDLSRIICVLEIGQRARDRDEISAGNPVDCVCMTSVLYDRVKSSPLWRLLCSLSSNAFGRKIFCPLFSQCRRGFLRLA